MPERREEMWQPMDTAPKDETPVLLWCVAGRGWAQTGLSKEFPESQWREWVDTYEGEDLPDPVAWMPLPQGPSQSHGKDE